MILGLGVIADGTDMQVPEHGITDHSGFEDRTGNLNPLPAGSVPDILMRSFLILFFFHIAAGK